MKRPIVFLPLLLLCVAACFLLNLFVGTADMPLSVVWAELTGQASDNGVAHFIVWENRFPMAVAALLVGMGLSVSGLLLQTLFRNPLAGPSVLGITSGASLGAAVVMLLVPTALSAPLSALNPQLAALLPSFSPLVGAFIGAMVVMLLIGWCTLKIQNSVGVLIIGLMIGYLASSAITLLNYWSTEQGVRSYTIWGMGDFGSISFGQLPLFSVACLVPLLASFLLLKPLNLLLMGEQNAQSLGVNVRRLRLLLLLLTGWLTAVCTAYCGPIAFIGLAVPHFARLLLRNDDHRQLLPTTLLLGGGICLLCNVVSVLPTTNGAIPINAITPFVGAPVVIYLITRRQQY